MKKIIIRFLPPLLLCNSAAAIELSQLLSTSTEPTPKIRVEPKYPISAARNGREGWATFSFVIEKDGSVSNVITQETSGSKDITLAAKKAVMKWQYQPAIENGEPIQQCVNSVQFDFRMHKNGTKKVTRRFNSLYHKTKAALAEKDYVKTKALLSKFTNIEYMHLSEHNFLQLLNAEYAKAIGNDVMQLAHLTKIKIATDDKNTEYELSLLAQRFVLELQLNKLKNAYDTYKRIEKISVAKPYLAHYQALIKQVDEFIHSEKELIVDADIRSDDYWHYALVRNEFTLTNIKGKLNKIDIRCANKRHVYSIENNNTWKIPDAWQQCHVFIFGENNTKFNLVEHPFKV
jgi:TonB family protein